mgnify:CR=1 FL=1
MTRHYLAAHVVASLLAASTSAEDLDMAAAWAFSAPASPASIIDHSPQQATPLRATVRVATYDGDTMTGVGTGTVVAADSSRAIIVTAAHVVAPSDSPSFRVAVESFDDTGVVARTWTAKTESIDEDSDVAILSVAGSTGLPTVGVLASPRDLRRGQAAVSVGCSNGMPPTVVSHVIRSTGRYLSTRGAGLVSTQPGSVSGRSGGGLFVGGQLAGVCSGSTSNESFFASIDEVRQLLDPLLAASAQLGVEQAKPDQGIRWVTSAVAAASPKPDWWHVSDPVPGRCAPCDAMRPMLADPAVVEASLQFDCVQASGPGPLPGDIFRSPDERRVCRFHGAPATVAEFVDRFTLARDLVGRQRSAVSAGDQPSGAANAAPSPPSAPSLSAARDATTARRNLSTPPREPKP